MDEKVASSTEMVRDHRGRRRLVQGLVVAAALLVGAAAGFAAGWSVAEDGDDDVSAAPDDSTTSASGGLQAVDRFDGDPGPLDGRPVGSSQAVWSVPSGSFEVLDDGGAAGDPGDEGLAVAVVTGAGPLTSLAASFVAPEKASGLVVRYKDNDNHWRFEASPDYGTWVIRKVADGKETLVGDVGFVGGVNIEVVMVGSTMQFWVDGTLRETVRDSFLQDQELGGLIVGKGGQDAICEQFAVNGL